MICFYKCNLQDLLQLLMNHLRNNLWKMCLIAQILAQ